MINVKYIVYTLSLVSFFFCLFQSGYFNYEYLFLLPLSLGIISIFLFRIYELLKNSFVFYIFILQAIIRYCILPVMIAYNNQVFYGADSLNGNTAIVIMILEIVFAFIALNLVASKQKASYLNKTNTITPIKNSFLLYVLIFMALIYIYQSGYLEKVNFIWNLSNYIQEYVLGVEELSDSGLGGILFNPFKIIVMLLIISWIIRSKKISNRLKNIFYFILLVVSSLFIVGSSRFSVLFFFLPMFVLILLITYQKLSKKLITLPILGLTLIVILTSSAKFDRDDNQSFYNIFSTSSLNAYFSGPGNIAVGLDAYEKISIKRNFLFCINDVFQNAPGLSKYTNDTYKTNQAFNKQIYGNIGIADQIVPQSISGIFHFDVIGAFFYVVFFLLIALYMERKYLKEQFLGCKYVYVSLSISLSMVFMMNISSMFFALFSTYLFVYLPFYFIHKFQSFQK